MVPNTRTDYTIRWHMFALRIPSRCADGDAGGRTWQGEPKNRQLVFKPCTYVRELQYFWMYWIHLFELMFVNCNSWVQLISTCESHAPVGSNLLPWVHQRANHRPTGWFDVTSIGTKNPGMQYLLGPLGNFIQKNSTQKKRSGQSLRSRFFYFCGPCSSSVAHCWPEASMTSMD